MPDSSLMFDTFCCLKYSKPSLFTVLFTDRRTVVATMAEGGSGG
jgi:hypothetical protein